MDCMEIRGRCGVAIAYAKVIEEEMSEQIRRMCDYAFTSGVSIRIMSDVHWSKCCTIGTTMTVRDKVISAVGRRYDSLTRTHLMRFV